MPHPVHRIRALAGAALAGAALLPAQEPPPIPSILELMETPVVSASRLTEALRETPATVVVLSRDDLDKRGYTQLSEILDDLPGMEVVRGYGADYVKNYMRGYRNDIGDPYLVLVDGQVFNHLWFNTADTAMVAYPLTGLERVEVVYGPASVVYGSNAFTGVINLITRKARAEGGWDVRARLAGGSFQGRVADLSLTGRLGEASLRLAFRRDEGNIDVQAAERYEYTRSAYLGNEALWGMVPGLGDPSSEHVHQGLDLRLAYGDTEFSFQQLETSNGYGLEYATDQSQRVGVWTRREHSFGLRHAFPMGRRVTGTLTARYRRSGVDPESYDVESYVGYGSGTASVLTHYEVQNASLSVQQDLEARLEALTLGAGLRFEQKILQKAYATSVDPAVPPDSQLDDGNHFTTEDLGAFVHGRLRVAEGHLLSLGVRSDHNSIYGTATTVRGGYVGAVGAWGVKALYGQAYQEPIPRLLYAATTGTGANPDLRPERSHTLELAGTYTQTHLGTSLGLYRVDTAGRIQTQRGQVVNAGRQEVLGADLGVQWLVPWDPVHKWKVWAHYTRIFRAEEDPGGGAPGHPTGDLATDKLWLGTTLTLSARFNGTLLARTIGPRPTVPSNPVGKVGGFTTVDLALHANDILGLWGLGLSLRISNLLDKAYDHPGLRDAGAGTTPGGFSGGAWAGSTSYYNSLMPQPGRAWTVTLRYAY